MAKRIIRKSSIKGAKIMGRSHGALVIDPVLGDKISPKTLTSRKQNNSRRYKNI